MTDRSGVWAGMIILQVLLVGANLKKFEKRARCGRGGCAHAARTAPITSRSIRERDGFVDRVVRTIDRGENESRTACRAPRVTTKTPTAHRACGAVPTKRWRETIDFATLGAGKRGCPGDATMCSTRRRDRRVPAVWWVVYPPRSGSSVAPAPRWRPLGFAPQTYA